MKIRTVRAAGALMVMTLATTLLAGAGIGQAATGPQNQFGIKLLEAPQSEAGDPRADIYIIDHLNPGATIHRNFQVSNTGSNQVTLHLYPGAASVARWGRPRPRSPRPSRPAAPPSAGIPRSP